MTDAIKIDGLKQFNKNLKTLDSDLPKAVRLALNDAAQIVVDDARPRVPKGSGKRPGRARRSVKAQSTRTRARVSGGGGKVPYYPWLDFGGRVGRNRSVHRPFKRKGRYIYRAYFRARDSGEFQDTLNASLVDVARKAGIEVN